METAASLSASGRHKKIIIVGADRMSSMVNYQDRATCPIFGDGAAACMVEATTEYYGIMDSILRTDGKGLPFLHMKAGGSVCPPSYFTVDHKMHYLYQEGRTVFKYAVSNMSDITATIAEKNGLNKDNIDWVIPHQANLRIICLLYTSLQIKCKCIFQSQLITQDRSSGREMIGRSGSCYDYCVNVILIRSCFLHQLFGSLTRHIQMCIRDRCWISSTAIGSTPAKGSSNIMNLGSIARQRAI